MHEMTMVRWCAVVLAVGVSCGEQELVAVDQNEGAEIEIAHGDVPPARTPQDAFTAIPTLEGRFAAMQELCGRVRALQFAVDEGVDLDVDRVMELADQVLATAGYRVGRVEAIRLMSTARAALLLGAPLDRVQVHAFAAFDAAISGEEGSERDGEALLRMLLAEAIVEEFALPDRLHEQAVVAVYGHAALGGAHACDPVFAWSEHEATLCGQEMHTFAERHPLMPGTSIAERAFRLALERRNWIGARALSGFARTTLQDEARMRAGELERDLDVGVRAKNTALVVKTLMEFLRIEARLEALDASLDSASVRRAVEAMVEAKRDGLAREFALRAGLSEEDFAWKAHVRAQMELREDPARALDTILLYRINRFDHDLFVRALSAAYGGVIFVREP
ncbi:hypothetical protein HYV74_01735 [Candidatus Uhrbacteria bacterium]|nr:hypothetical protein [Candidatus Uhrbacteria bacterium]